MQRSESAGVPRPTRTRLPDLDLRPPVRLDGWAFAFAVGVVLTTLAPLLGLALVVCTLVVALAGLLKQDFLTESFRLHGLVLPVFVGAGFLVALVHASAADPLRELALLGPGRVEVVGRVASPPVPSGFGERADLTVESLAVGDEEALRGGGVEVFAPGLDGVGVGDRLRVTGELSVPEVGDFDYARYLSTEGISAVLEGEFVEPVGEGRGWIGTVHRRTDVALGYGLRPTEAAVVRGMVLGDRSRIPEGLDEAFRRSGITHVLAISGQHVAVLAAALYFLARLLGIPAGWRIGGTVALVWLYIAVAGAPPSAVRAGVAATFFLLGALVRRKPDALHLVGVMLAAVLAWNPLLIYNTGFQLSVAAVLGILLLRKPIRSVFERLLPERLVPERGAPKLLLDLFCISLAAQVATAPVVAASFGEVSIVGVLANLVAVPLSGPILCLGLLSSTLGNVAPALAYLPNAANGFLVTILSGVARGASNVGFATLKTPGVSAFMVGVFYLGCLPAAVCGLGLPKSRWPFWAGVMLVWVAGWLALANLARV